MSTIRFRSQRAKLWWADTLKYLKNVRKQHAFEWKSIDENILAHKVAKKIQPLKFNRALSPEPIKSSRSMRNRVIYPLSSGFIDLDTVDTDNEQGISSYLYDYELAKALRKYRRKKKKRKFNLPNDE